MGALHILSYVAGVAAFLFILLSLASGLLYVAEVIEEHSATAKAIGQRAIYAIILFLIVMYFTDGLPAYICGLLIFAHIVYLQNFARTWPSISLTSPTFILSCILVIVSHFVTFSYFSDRSHQPRKYSSSRNSSSWNRGGKFGGGGIGSSGEESFLDVATFFGVCVWLVPFYLFLSLSANDNVLPSAGDLSSSASAPSTPTHQGAYHQRKNSSILKTALSGAFSLFLRKPGGSNQRDGLIASPQLGRSRPSSPGIYSPNLNGGSGQNLWGQSTNSPPPPRSPGISAYPYSPPSPYGQAVDRRPSLTPRMPNMPPRRATEGHVPTTQSPAVSPQSERPRPPPLTPRRPSYSQQELLNLQQRSPRRDSPEVYTPPPPVNAGAYGEGLVKRKGL